MSKIKRYIPKILEENDTMNSIYSTQEDEINKLNQTSMDVFKNNFIQTANLNGIQKYENMLKIKSDNSFDLEYRRKKVWDKLIYRPPFTRQRFQSILERIWGKGNFVFDIHPNEFEVIIDVWTDNAEYYLLYSKMIRDVIPANLYMILSIKYTYMFLSKHYNYNKMGQELTYQELSRYSEI